MATPEDIDQAYHIIINAVRTIIPDHADQFEKSTKKTIQAMFKYNNIVPSTEDIDDLLDYFCSKTRDDDITEDIINKISRTISKTGIIYVSGNIESYKKIVVDLHKVSKREHEMMKGIKQGNKQGFNIIYRDTEFPVDAAGRYIV